MWGSVVQMIDGEEVDEWMDLWLHGWMNIFWNQGVYGYMLALNIQLHFKHTLR